MIVSLLAGLVPPPLLSSMAGNVVPEAMAETVAQRATALLPKVKKRCR